MTHDLTSACVQKQTAPSQAGLKSWLRRGAKAGGDADIKSGSTSAADGADATLPTTAPAQQQVQHTDLVDQAGQQTAKSSWMSRISGAYSSAGDFLS